MNMSAPDRNCNHNDALAVFGIASHEEALELWLGHCQQLFHQMVRDGVPLDKMSNRMSRMSHLKG